jgi:hypothetical protein
MCAVWTKCLDQIQLARFLQLKQLMLIDFKSAPIAVVQIDKFFELIEMHSRSIAAKRRSASNDTLRYLMKNKLRGALLFGQEQPGFEYGVGTQRYAVDALLHQPMRKVGMIRWTLAADADVFTVLLAR